MEKSLNKGLKQNFIIGKVLFWTKVIDLAFFLVFNLFFGETLVRVKKVI